MLNKFPSTTGDDLLNHNDNNVPAGVEFFLVNGQHQPTLNIEQGEWTRLRVIFSSLSTVLELQMTQNDIDCEWFLLAKDGIFVEAAPRTFGDIVYMAPGNRVDIVMRCRLSGLAIFGTEDTPQIISIAVSASTSKSNIDLPIFSPHRPDYLADLYTASKTDRFDMDIVSVPGSCTLNGKLWDGSTPIGFMETGSIQEWNLHGLAKHPFHIHVNSFQLSEVSSHSGFFQTGDWHDVLYTPVGIAINKSFFAVDSFVTKSVLHCHFLTHEDRGCMGYIQHTGIEGATTGLCGHEMYCLGTSTGSSKYTRDCRLSTPPPSRNFLRNYSYSQVLNVFSEAHFFICVC